MRLLFDQNLSPRLVRRLADLFPASDHVHLLGLDQAADDEVWAYAHTHGFTIVSKDTDFSEMSMVRGSPPKVIWIKRGNCSTNDIEAILRRDHRLIAELEQNETLRILLLY